VLPLSATAHRVHITFERVIDDKALDRPLLAIIWIWTRMDVDHLSAGVQTAVPRTDQIRSAASCHPQDLGLWVSLTILLPGSERLMPPLYWQMQTALAPVKVCSAYALPGGAHVCHSDCAAAEFSQQLTKSCSS
jgi:hypothetical protein